MGSSEVVGDNKALKRNLCESLDWLARATSSIQESATSRRRIHVKSSGTSQDFGLLCHDETSKPKTCRKENNARKRQAGPGYRWVLRHDTWLYETVAVREVGLNWETWRRTSGSGAMPCSSTKNRCAQWGSNCRVFMYCGACGGGNTCPFQGQTSGEQLQW